MKRSLIAALLAAPLMAGAAPAQAQPSCPGELVPYNVILPMAARMYGETPAFQGIDESGSNLLVVTLNPSGDGTWSVFVIDTNGCAAMVAAGVSGEVLEPKPVGDPA